MPPVSARPQYEVSSTICQNSIYQKSFFPDTIRLWNSLPQTIVSCLTIDSFKEELSASPQTPLDSYWMFLTALYIDLLGFVFTLVVPAPPTHQYDDTPDNGVSTILEEEEEDTAQYP